MKNTKYKKISVGRAGSGEIDLATGKIIFAHEDVCGNSSVLPVAISHIYSTKDAIGNDDVTFGKGFKLNLQQKLSHKPNDETKWKYIDGSGEEHKFKERYYYRDEDNKKVFTNYKPEDIKIEQDGRLYSIANPEQELFVEIRTKSGYSLQTELKSFVGHKKLETRQEELVSLENEIDNLSRGLLDLDAALTEYNKYETKYSINDALPPEANNVFTIDALLDRQRNLEEYSLRLEEKSFESQDGAAKILRSDIISLTNDINSSYNNPNKDCASCTSRTSVQENLNITSYQLENLSWNNSKRLTFSSDANGLPNQQQMLRDKRELQDLKVIYDDKEQARVKAQYAKQKEIVKRIKKTYKKTLSSRQYTLEQFNIQLPVNYVIGEDRIVLGFNKAGDLVALFDNYDNQVGIVYKEGRISSIVDSENKEINFEYYPNGKLHAIVDVEDRKTVYQYGTGSESDLLKQVIYPNGEITEFEYIESLMTKITPPSEIGVTLNYIDCQVTSIIAKANVNRQTTIQYQATQTIVTDVKTGSTSTYVFADNTKENLIGETHLSNGKTGYVTYGGDDATFDYTLEQESFVLGLTHNSNLTRTQLESLSGQVQTTGSPVVWSFSEIENRKVIKQYSSPKTAAGTSQTTTKTFDYDDNDVLVEEKITIQTTGKTDRIYTTKYEYNKQQRPIRSIVTSNIDPVGMVSETIYDKKGNVIRSQSYHKSNPSSKFIEEREVAENGQVTAEFDERGNRSVIKYEPNTNIVSGQIDSNGNETSVGRDPHTDEIVSISSSVDGEANTNKLVYEKELLKSLESGNTKIDYTYDEFGRRTSVSLNDKTHVSYVIDDATNNVKANYMNEYVPEGYETITDDFGKVLEVRYHKGGAWVTHLKNDYNEKDKLRQTIDYVASKVSTISYDNNGNVIASEVTDLVYDAGGNLVSEAAVISLVSSTFDVSGNVQNSTVTIHEDEKTYSHQYGYVYDEEENLESIFMSAGSAIEKIERDKLGRTTKLNVVAGKREINYLQVGERATSLVASETYQSNNGEFSKLRYTYDNNGNITQIHEAGRLKVRYTYDGLNRLVREDNATLGRTYTYEYDTNGNIVYKNKNDFSLDSELPDGVNIAYTNDGDKLMQIRTQEGNAITVSDFAYDDLGNPKMYRGVNMQWDRVRNLASYNNGEVTFEYDASNTRTAKRVNNEDTKFFYNGSQLIAAERRIKTSDLSAGDPLDPGYAYTQNMFITYLYGVDGISGFKVEQENEMPKHYFYRKNIMGDVLAIYEITEDATEEILESTLVAEYTYDAWGNHIVKNYTDEKIGDLNPIRYRGYYYDTETNLFYLLSRYYDPETGKFINQDIIEILDETRDMVNGLNLFAYCLNNPIMMIDETGMLFAWINRNLINPIANKISNAVNWVGNAISSTVRWGVSVVKWGINVAGAGLELIGAVVAEIPSYVGA